MGQPHGSRREGIIPAYAGNTLSRVSHGVETRDHPRVCGEHPYLGAGDLRQPGSSPRMRGTPSILLELSPNTGIIPAYAGNTSKTTTPSSSTKDHPRVCGEHIGIAVPAELRSGSSPRMRGTRCIRAARVCCRGIIPAYAGNTQCKSSCTKVQRDHPRVCGEHRGLSTFVYRPPGSSPRMRGTLKYVECAHCGEGIIPAYAGNTSAC